MDRYKGSPNREVELISKNYPQFGSESATRLREAGITSNRRSERYGEYVLGSCTHRPSHQESRQYQKALRQNGDYGRVGNKGEVVTRHP